MVLFLKLPSFLLEEFFTILLICANETIKRVLLSQILSSFVYFSFLQTLNIVNAYEDKRFDPTVSED